MVSNLSPPFRQFAHPYPHRPPPPSLFYHRPTWVRISSYIFTSASPAPGFGSEAKESSQRGPYSLGKQVSEDPVQAPPKSPTSNCHPHSTLWGSRLEK